MKKKFAIPVLLVLLFFVLACSISMEGISIGDEQKPLDPFQEMIAEETFEAMLSQEPDSAPVDAATPEPVYQPVDAAATDMERTVTGSHEYSIASNNFDCICQATENMMVDIKFVGSQVEITNGGGGATMVYDKVSENQYQKVQMGYYILKSETGEETKVDEEDRTLITFTTSGYVMESFKGDESSPCCYYTFTKQ